MAWAMAIPGMISAVSGMMGQQGSASDAADKRREARSVAEGIPDLVLPDQDYSFLDYAGDYNPYAYATPQQAQYQTINEDPRMRQTEMDALQRLVEQGNAVGQARAESQRYAALDEANQLARGREGAIRQQMQRSGQGGNGMDAILQAQSAQSAANRARVGTMDAVHQAALQKLANEQAIIGGAGNIRGQDFNTASHNADIINRFNMFNTQANNEISQRNVENRNAAQLRNLNTHQDIRGRNTGIANANVDRRVNRAKAIYGSKVDRSNSIVNAINGQAAQANTNGQVYNQLGQQGAQLFTNVGAGITAEQARQPQGTISVRPPQQDDDQGTPYDQMIVRG